MTDTMQHCRTPFTLSAVGLLTLTVALACTRGEHDNVAWVGAGPDYCIDNSNSRRPPDTLIVAPTDTSNTDSRLALRTRELPGGFGGMYVENGQTVVLLTDIDQQAQAAAALQSMGDLVPDVRHVSFRQARWTFADLLTWSQYIARAPMPGLRSSSIDDANNRIVLGVADKDYQRSSVELLNAMRIPCQLVAVKIVGTIRAAGA